VLHLEVNHRGCDGTTGATMVNIPSKMFTFSLDCRFLTDLLNIDIATRRVTGNHEIPTLGLE
jgi:hypothetical protein